jgi:hypothetical protein
MTDTPVRVATTEDIHGAHDEITGRDAEVAAELLSDGADAVLWLMPWLTDEKDLAYAPGDVTVAEVTVERETEKAWCVRQEGEVWVPKSQSVLFHPAEGVDRVDSQQQRLGGTQ